MIYSDLLNAIKILLVLYIVIDAIRVFFCHVLFESNTSIINISYYLSSWYCQKKDGTTEEIIMKQLISFRKIIMVRFKLKKNSNIKTLFLWDDNTIPENFHYLLIQTKLFKEDYET